MYKKGDVLATKARASSEFGRTAQDTRLIVIDHSAGGELLGVPIVTHPKGEEHFLAEDSLLNGRFEAPVWVQYKRFTHVSQDACVYLFSLKPNDFDQILRKIIFYFTEKHYEWSHADKPFIPGKSYIRYAGRVYDAKEMVNLMDAGLDFWLTEGRFAKRFETEFAEFLGTRHCILTNSGSSANLLAVSALTSPKLGEKRLKPGDEVIAAACAFPTTVSPIIQNNLVPVFLDVEIGTYNIQADQLEAALSEKTKAVFLAHTLGNPFDIEKVMRVAQKYDLWVIEDACDALGTRYKGNHVGTFGHIATFSFYAAHQITMGEGGALVTNDIQLKRIIESFRDWGRDCWCATGHDNTCGKRFDWQLGTLPEGYDHKYIYSHMGYNLKITDPQAAIGLEQLKKLPRFIAARRNNWAILYDCLKKYEKYFLLPQATAHAEPCWFGFPLTIRKNAPFSRDQIVAFLEKNNIATRSLFAGNIIRHPAFEHVQYRIHQTLENTDTIMNDAFWIGVYPGLTTAMLDYVISKIGEFTESRHSKF